MTASYNISFLGSPEQAESRASKKGYRSSNYNNYMVEVVDFDNESHTFEVDARSESEASELAADMAMSAGVQPPCLVAPCGFTTMSMLDSPMTVMFI